MRLMPVRTAALLLLCVLVTYVMPANASDVAPDASARCQALMSMDFSAIQEAPTQISAVRHIENAEELLSDLPDLSALPPNIVAVMKKSLLHMQPMCRVAGYVTPNVGFLLALPDDHWNGKFLHLGCGGWCGDFRWFVASCALHPQYACVGTDMGHEGQGGLWFRNNVQAQVDFSYRATHVATLAGRAIVARYYGQSPHKSYFMGCSTGGYQGLTEAQRYPFDFDGIIAGAPDMDEADLAVRGIWLKQHYLDAKGKPVLGTSDVQLIHDAALARCDRDDGLKDGIISDPAHCRFDPGELQCRPGQQTRCLTPAQVQAVKSFYGSPATSSGLILSTRGVFPGSELNWPESFAEVWGESYFHDTGLLPQSGREWTYRDFDFDRDYPRSGAGVLFIDTNPDLRKFKAAGGKLISYQGGNDTAEIPGAIVDYYETVERTMGGEASTRDFYRFFVIPGMNHCGGGVGAFAFDYLTPLEDWVERGQAPDRLVGAHVEGIGPYGWLYLHYPLDPDAQVTFTRPIYPYPNYARYSGKGDPHSAASFRPAIQAQPSNRDVAEPPASCATKRSASARVE